MQAKDGQFARAMATRLHRLFSDSSWGTGTWTPEEVTLYNAFARLGHAGRPSYAQVVPIAHRMREEALHFQGDTPEATNNARHVAEGLRVFLSRRHAGKRASLPASPESYVPHGMTHEEWEDFVRRDRAAHETPRVVADAPVPRLALQQHLQQTR
jgi:hypothetical protein